MENNPAHRLTHWKPKQPQGVMFVAGISSRGPTVMHCVPTKAKVNVDSYTNKVLKSLFEIDIHRLFGKDSKNVIVHQESAPAHVTAKTVKWRKDRDIKIISTEDWPVNASNLSPMVYAINGILKESIFVTKEFAP